MGVHSTPPEVEPMTRDATRAFLVLLVSGAGIAGCTESDWSVPSDVAGSPTSATKRTLAPDWTPERLGPAAWYVASAKDFVVAKDGAARWADRSGNARDATQASRSGTPELFEDGWSGAPTLHFDGGRQLVVKSWAEALTGENADYSVLAVMRSGAPAQNAAIAGFWDPNGGGFAWAGLKGSDGLTLLDLTQTHGLSDSQMYTAPHDLGTLPHVVAWRYRASSESIELTVDGSTTVSSKLAPIEALPAMPLVIGAKSQLPTGGFVGDLSELVIVERALPDTDVSDFVAYARANWPSLSTEGSADPCVAADGARSPETTRCDDGNAETYGDHCSAGLCVGKPARDGSPAELAPAAWYHAGSAEVAVTEGGVSTWFDRTPNHADLTQGFYFGRPTFDDRGWDGAREPALRFGGHALLRRARWQDMPSGSDAPFTVFAVLRAKDPASGGFASLLPANGEKLPDLGADRHVVVWQQSSSGVTLTLDGHSENLAAESPRKGGGQQEFLVGSERPFAPAMFDGYIAELALIPGLLADEEVARLCRYAADEWGGIRLTQN
jgi:hypothetical protein